MKLILSLLLLPTLSFAAKMPVDIFDQSKLETLLRNIPSALARTETHDGFVRKHYLFPKNKRASFKIQCQADYYSEAKIPSFKSCELDVSNKDFVGDETLIKITDDSMVKSLREAISYGDEVKKFHSFERIYGQSHDGANRTLFRYTFICKRDVCDLTFASKPAP